MVGGRPSRMVYGRYGVSLRQSILKSSQSLAGLISQQILLDAKLRRRITIPHVILLSSAGGLPEGEPGAFMKLVSTIAKAQSSSPADMCMNDMREAASVCFDAKFSKDAPNRVDAWISNFIKYNRYNNFIEIFCNQTY